MNSPPQGDLPGQYADKGKFWTVSIGEYDRSSRGNRDKEPHDHVERKIKSIIRHRLFDKKTFNYDIALIEIDGLPVIFQVSNLKELTFSF